MDYLEKNLRVKQKGGKTWNFTDKNAANADALFVFHRDVEAARQETGGRLRARSGSPYGTRPDTGPRTPVTGYRPSESRIFDPMKRILLFVATNLAIMVTLSIVLSLLGINGYGGLQGQLLFCLVWGMGGAFISLQMSRFIAKRAMGVQLVDGRTGHDEPTGCTARSGSSPSAPACRCPKSASTTRRK